MTLGSLSEFAECGINNNILKEKKPNPHLFLTQAHIKIETIKTQQPLNPTDIFRQFSVLNSMLSLYAVEKI